MNLTDRNKEGTIGQEVPTEILVFESERKRRALCIVVAKVIDPLRSSLTEVVEVKA